MTRPPSPRTEVKRLPQRSRYDAEVVHGILDEALVCHVGFVIDGEPVVIPTIHARHGDQLYLHGSPASRMLKSRPFGTRNIEAKRRKAQRFTSLWSPVAPMAAHLPALRQSSPLESKK